MFGKNKKQVEPTSMVINKGYSDTEEFDMINNAFNQNNQNIPMNQVPNIPRTMNQTPIQQVQPVQQFNQVRVQPQAVIIKGEVLQDNEYGYTVITNYPLSLGSCNISN